MQRSFSRISIALGASGLLAAGLATTATTASAASATSAPAWHTVLSVPNSTGFNLVDTVVATGKTSGWAFLNNGTAYERAGTTKWKKVAFPGKDAAVNSAGASSPSNVWVAALGLAGTETKIYHWNGGKWTLAKTLPNGADITALSVLGPNDVWMFGGLGKTGSDGVFHFNGHKWTEVSATLQGGSALSDNNVWAFNGTQVAHYNGKKWSTASVAKLLPPPSATHVSSSVTDIVALAPDNVYATGEAPNPQAGPGVVLHDNGRAWSRVAESSSLDSVPGKQLTSDGAGGLWIPAQIGTTAGLFHYSAGRVTAVTLPGGATGVSVSRIPGTTEELSGGARYGTGYGDSVVLQS
jgi:hypothetical protein